MQKEIKTPDAVIRVTGKVNEERLKESTKRFLKGVENAKQTN